MLDRKSVIIIEGGQTGKASCMCLPAAKWEDPLDWIEPPPPLSLEDLFLYT